MFLNKKGGFMGELRKDYILDDWVIISSSRGARPHQFVEEEKVEDKTCFFCPGSELLTPKEIGRVPAKNGWLLRWFNNKFAAVEACTTQALQTHNRFYTFAQNCGTHEIIVETPDHAKQLWDLSFQDLERVFTVYQNRIFALETQGMKYVCVFKNHGVKAGTSLVHAHSQVIAQPLIPKRVQDKLAATRRFLQCPYCDIVQSEKNSERRVFENEQFAAFAPYASRFNYEVWIFPKHHATRLDQLDLCGMAEAVQHVLARLKTLHCSYNMTLTYAPASTDLHLHVEICPRTATWAGYEIESGIIINSVPPEDAARFYRNE
ncbi:galactose-1-phosphate uridylyltransferase [Candidatus Woesearchaeota archaeon]|nr:galactose-1-phosphate uridylyltransferase [Candidatus Woesearchaeota archaeon]